MTIITSFMGLRHFAHICTCPSPNIEAELTWGSSWIVSSIHHHLPCWPPPCLSSGISFCLLPNTQCPQIMLFQPPVICSHSTLYFSFPDVIIIQILLLPFQTQTLRVARSVFAQHCIPDFGRIPRTSQAFIKYLLNEWMEGGRDEEMDISMDGWMDGWGTQTTIIPWNSKIRISHDFLSHQNALPCFPCLYLLALWVFLIF